MKLIHKMVLILWGVFSPLVVSAEIPSMDLGQIVVTASRIAQYDYKITGNVTVIDKEQILATNAQNIPDVLKNSLGVNVFDNSTNKTSKLDIRGFGETSASNILFLVNDRKTNSIDMSGADLLQIPIESVERIEIIRGAGSVLYGDNAVGGVVNIITKKGEGNLSGKVGSKYGSYDRRSVDAQVSGEKKGISYFLYSNYDDDRGYRQNSDMLAKDFQTRLGYAFSEKFSLDIETALHEDDYGQPGSLTDAQIDSLSRRGSANEEDTAATRDRFVNLSLNMTPWPEDIYLGKFVLDMSYRNRDAYTDNVAWASDTKNSIDTTGINAKYIFDRTIFGKDVNFVTGIDYYDHENYLIREATSKTELTISKEEFGFYGFLEYELFDDLYINGGTRLHQADYVFNKMDGTHDITQDPDEWVSMGGLKYEYEKGSNIFMNVQQTFRFLATDEWFNSITGVLNTDLQQQTGIQYEAGIKHNLRDGLIVSLTPYMIDIDKEIYYNPQGGLWGWGANENYDKTRRTGVEIGSELDFLKYFKVPFLSALKLFLNYNYQNPRFEKGVYDGNHIPLIPRHQTSFNMMSEFTNHIFVSLSGRYIGSRYAGSDTSNVLPLLEPYYVLDGKISYEKKNYELFFEINNILDEKYSTFVTSFGTTKYYYPAPEQNFNVGMKIKF